MNDLQKHKEFVENLLDRLSKGDDGLWDGELDRLDKMDLGVQLLSMVILATLKILEESLALGEAGE